MKRQYLGDSKDSFKWDYLDFLVRALGYGQLQIIWMMTPDDNSLDGKIRPERFPARPEILNFCNLLRKALNPKLLCGLPKATGASYSIDLYKPDKNFKNADRDSYFFGVGNDDLKQVLFLDPDNGFEPEHSENISEKHVLYADVEKILKRVPFASVVTVFQNHRRKKFPDDFARIRQRLRSGNSTAIYYHSLMFVSISSSPETIRRVRQINREYAKCKPVKTLP